MAVGGAGRWRRVTGARAAAEHAASAATTHSQSLMYERAKLASINNG